MRYHCYESASVRASLLEGGERSIFRPYLMSNSLRLSLSCACVSKKFSMYEICYTFGANKLLIVSLIVWFVPPVESATEFSKIWLCEVLLLGEGIGECRTFWISCSW